MLAALLVVLASALAGSLEPARPRLAIPGAGRTAAEARARWTCEPSAVEVGQPFALVLELEHAADLGVRGLVPEALTLDESWVVLGAEAPARGATSDGRLRTRWTWRVASLEPGERSLAEALAGVALGEAVTRIQVGDARVAVAGLLAEGEDAPRPMRAFPEGFADAAPLASASPWSAALLAGIGLLVAGALLGLGWRRRSRPRPAPAPTALERLLALEGEAAQASRERCYALTRLLREAGDELSRKPRGALTDEEWLAAVHASLEIPRGVVAELSAVFERAARVKYAGEAPTEWALQETFSRARGALEALKGGARP